MPGLSASICEYLRVSALTCKRRCAQFPGTVPYADPTEQKAYNLELYLRRYASDPEFRADEAYRKQIWYERNQEKIVAAYREKRKKIRAARRSVRTGKLPFPVEAPFPRVIQPIALIL